MSEIGSRINRYEKAHDKANKIKLKRDRVRAELARLDADYLKACKAIERLDNPPRYSSR